MRRTPALAALVLLAASGPSACKPKASTASVRDLGSFTDGVASRNQCVGPAAARASAEVQAVMTASRADGRTPSGAALEQALAAVPVPSLRNFLSLGGRVQLGRFVDPGCRLATIGHPAGEGGVPLSTVALDACYLFQSKDRVTGAPSLVISLVDDPRVIAAETVRQFGYLESQIFSRLTPAGDKALYAPDLAGAAKSRLQGVASAYLRDVGASGDLAKVAKRWFGAAVGAGIVAHPGDLAYLTAAARAAGKGALALQFIEFVYAEAYDSYNCSVTGTRPAMKSRFPRTFAAYAGTGAGLRLADDDACEGGSMLEKAAGEGEPAATAAAAGEGEPGATAAAEGEPAAAAAAAAAAQDDTSLQGASTEEFFAGDSGERVAAGAPGLGAEGPAVADPAASGAPESQTTVSDTTATDTPDSETTVSDTTASDTTAADATTVAEESTTTEPPVTTEPEEGLALVDPALIQKCLKPGEKAAGAAEKALTPAEKAAENAATVGKLLDKSTAALPNLVKEVEVAGAAAGKAGTFDKGASKLEELMNKSGKSPSVAKTGGVEAPPKAFDLPNPSIVEVKAAADLSLKKVSREDFNKTNPIPENLSPAEMGAVRTYLGAEVADPIKALVKEGKFDEAAKAVSAEKMGADAEAFVERARVRAENPDAKLPGDANFTDINGALRGNKPPKTDADAEYLDKVTKNLDSVFAKSTVKEPTTVYRFTGDGKYNTPDAAGLLPVDKGFTSTARTPAMEFNKEGKVLQVIELPAGQSAINMESMLSKTGDAEKYVDRMRKATGEPSVFGRDELLLPRNTQLQLVRETTDPKTGQKIQFLKPASAKKP